MFKKTIGSKQRKLFYKIPSFIHKVNYDQIVHELWGTDLTKDDKKKIGRITTPRRRVTVSHFEGGLPLPEGVWRKDLCHTTRNRKRIKKQTCNTYYILNTTNRNELVNGLRDIKELLLQYHNVSMYEA